MKTRFHKLMLLFLLLNTGGFADYAVPRPDPGFEFPRDHGSHDDFRTEWWYFTGNLEGEDGTPFGFELTFFRNRMLPPSEVDGEQIASALVPTQVYMAHFAISDIGARRHHAWERMGRAGLGQGSASERSLDVRLGPWSATMNGEGAIELRASAEKDGAAIELTLTPAKPFVIHGENGVDRKSDDPRQASHYISFTRLNAQGSLRIGGREHRVAGRAWMDHEFFSNLFESGDKGWDWFALQLDNGWDMMFYRLLRADGSYTQASPVALVDPDGRLTHIAAEGIEVAATGSWTSPESGAEYPMGWTLKVPARGIDLTITPAFEAQEMSMRGGLGTRYWEGAVRIGGRFESEPIEGKGYVELVGYAGALKGI